MENWKDPSGNICKVDPSKWSKSDLEQRLKDGWSKAAAEKVAAPVVEAPKAPKGEK